MPSLREAGYVARIPAGAAFPGAASRAFRRDPVVRRPHSAARVLRYLHVHLGCRTRGDSTRWPMREIGTSLAQTPDGEEFRKMLRLRSARLLSIVIVTAMPLGVLAPACSSTSSTSTKGQLISCADNGTGVTSCHPLDTATTGSGSGAGSGTCEDVDEDGDGSPHDVGEDRHDPMTGAAMGSAGSDADDDDHDGIPNDRDCDRRHGGDDDGEDHHGGHDGSGSGDHDGSDDGSGDGSGSGGGSDDGSGHH